MEQALLVSQELVRVGILWHELWQEGIERASQMMFGPEKNVEGMLGIILPLHEMLANGPQTSKEAAFLQKYGPDLAEAHRCCARS